MPRKVVRSHGAHLLTAWRGQMPQSEACKLIGLDPSTYNRFEKGRRRPGGQWAARIEAITSGAVPASSWYQPHQSTEPEALAS